MGGSQRCSLVRAKPGHTVVGESGGPSDVENGRSMFPWMRWSITPLGACSAGRLPLATVSDRITPGVKRQIDDAVECVEDGFRHELEVVELAVAPVSVLGSRETNGSSSLRKAMTC
ncbi:hypothetical protein IM25_24725 (plasmid) [Rhodococcus sp. p52]|nr:hypothetical protein IM25_24725 [Rhodococcus sp. p52]